MQGSLRDLAWQRLGRTDLVVTTAASFNGRLGAAMTVAAPDTIGSTASLIVVTGTVSHAASGRTATSVRIYGVDETFWAFHGVSPVALAGGEAAASHRLASDLGAADGDLLTVHARGPSEIPLVTLPGPRDAPPARIEVTKVRTLEPERLGEFTLQLEAGPVSALFVPLSRLQRELNLPGNVNTILVRDSSGDRATGEARPPIDRVRHAWLAGAALPDFGVRIRRVPGDRVMALEGLGGTIDPAIAARVQAALHRVQRPGVPALTYVATAIRAGDRSIPYSIVSAIDIDAYNRLSVPLGPPAPGTDAMSTGDPLVRGSLEVRVGRGGARIGRVQVTEAERRRDQASPVEPDPQPPSDAPVPEAASQGPLWLNEWAVADLGARAGDIVHIEYYVWTDRDGLEARQAAFTMQGVMPMMRIGGDRTLMPDFPGITNARDHGAWNPPFPVDRTQFRPLDEAYWARWRTSPKAFIPLEAGQQLWGTRFGDVTSIRFAVRDAEAVAAAVREEATGRIAIRPVRHDAGLAAAGGTRARWYLLALAASPALIALLLVYLAVDAGVERRARDAGVLAAIGLSTLRIRRAFFRESVGVLLVGVVVGIAGSIGYAGSLLHGLSLWWEGAAADSNLRLHVEPLPWIIGIAAASALATAAVWAGTGVLGGRSPRALMAGRARAETRRPRLAWRSSAPASLSLRIAAVLVIAAFAFALLNARVLRPDRAGLSPARESGTGGFALIAEADLPLMHDPNTSAGAVAVGLETDSMRDAHVVRVRLRPGDTTDWLAPYQPRHPRIAGVTPADLAGRFAFANPGNTPAGESPWQLLDQPLADDAVPAIVDRRTLTYVLGLRVGDTFSLAADGLTTVTFRVVASLEDSVLGSQILIGETAFVRLFPRDEGFPLWLIDAPQDRAGDLAAALEERGWRIRRLTPGDR